MVEERLKYNFSLALLLLVTLTLRVWQINSYGYWIDEMSSIHFASQPGWQSLLWDNSPPLYHFLLKIWIWVFGSTELATRFLSVLFSLVTTYLWCDFGYKKNGFKGFLVAGILHSTFYFSLFYARETRMYSLFELSSTIIFLQTLAVISEGKKINWKLYGGFLLAIFVHYLSIVPLFISVLCLFLYSKNKKSQYGLIFLGIISAVLISKIRWESLQWQSLKFVIEEEQRWPWEMLLDILSGWGGVALLILMLIISLVKKNKIILTSYAIFIFILIGSTALGFAFERAIFLSRYFIYLSPLIVFIYFTFLTQNLTNKYLKLFTFVLIIFFQMISWPKAFFKIHPPWKEASRVIRLIPQSVILTSRPLSMKSPYFEIENVEFRKITLENLAKLIEFSKLESSFQVRSFILENYWGYQSLEKSLKEELEKQNCHEENVVNPDENQLIHFSEIICPR